MISYHRNKSFKDDEYSKGFEVADTKDLERLSRGISKFVWSPIIWKNGLRHQKWYLNARYAVLDFDDGETTLEEAKRKFCDVNHIIGTTRNHQKSKGEKPAVDRFRVILEFEQPITDLRIFRYNMTVLIRRHGTDKLCKDGARFYYPCKEIVSVLTDADKMPIGIVPPWFENSSTDELKQKLARVNYKITGRLPKFCDAFLKTGKVIDGKGRQSTAFITACEMKLAGIPKDKAYSLLLNAPIDRTDFAENELIHAVDSAYKK